MVSGNGLSLDIVGRGINAVGESPGIMRFLVLSCSLSENSRSRRMAEVVRNDLDDAGEEVDFVDLRHHALPFCDGGAAYGDPAVAPIAERVKRADGIILAGPIYNYDYNAAAKNVVEMTGSGSWSGKVVGFIAAAGGQGSYLSVLPLANSLMADFRCVIVPRFVYADGSAFGDDGELDNEEVRERIRSLGVDLVGFTQGLAGVLENR
ncbi:MAG: NADPH-dependent FMN reductase [Verrucomicrobiota bacterium]